MKEEQPQGDFQIQEERRLFYVALTRAQQRLTLSTIVNRRKKPSPFLEDFLMNPKIQKLDTAQSAPKVQCLPDEEETRPRSKWRSPIRRRCSVRCAKIRRRIRGSRCGPRRFIRRARSRCN